MIVDDVASDILQALPAGRQRSAGGVQSRDGFDVVRARPGGAAHGQRMVGRCRLTGSNPR